MKKIFQLFVLCITLSVQAQTKQNYSKSLTPDDSIALETLASYPDSIRPNIFAACKNPDFLVKTEALQKNTSELFRNLIDAYNKDEQVKFWDLARYPGLISKMAGSERKSKEELELIASQYPQEIRSTVVEYGRKHHDVLNDINALSNRTNSEFEKIIADYPDQSKASYRGLINRPDVLNTLSSNMHLSVIVGNMYTADPKQTLFMFDSIRAEQIKQSAKAKEDWKNGLEKDPEAKKEMEQAALEFIKDKEPDSQVDDVYNTAPYNPKPQVMSSPPTLNPVIYPYPYWYGYPWWYTSPYWYPYPYWYNVGFYWGSGGIVYFGYPSPFFMNWYFYHPYHHYNYSHFTNYCLGYHDSHYGPRTQTIGFNREIHNWTRANEPNLPKGYLRADANRQTRIKEYGKFEMNYHDNTKGVFGRNITRPEFLQNNPNYYPNLRPALKQRTFNQQIKYPAQQNPARFNMGRPVKMPTQTIQKSGGGARGRK